MLAKLDSWYFSEDTKRVSRQHYLLFMSLCFFFGLISFSPLFVGHGYGAALFGAAFAMDLYLQFKLPIHCKFPLSFMVAAATLFIVAGWLFAIGVWT